MTVGHLLFAAVTTAYIFVGIFLEERDLVELFGDEYRRYRELVGMVIPFRRDPTSTVPPERNPRGVTPAAAEFTAGMTRVRGYADFRSPAPSSCQAAPVLARALACAE